MDKQNQPNIMEDKEKELIINALEGGVIQYSAPGLTLIQIQDEAKISYSKLKLRLRDLEDEKKIISIDLTKERNHGKNKLYCLKEVNDCIKSCYTKKLKSTQKKLEI